MPEFQVALPENFDEKSGPRSSSSREKSSTSVSEIVQVIKVGMI